MADAPDLAALEQLAVDLVLEAGALIVDERPADLGVSKTKSTVTDVVTVMDQRAQDLLLRRVRDQRPEDAFLGEEEGGLGGSTGITWVVDPIDGTVNYLYGIPSYAVSVAAVTGDPTTPGAWRPIAGAVYNPISRELYRAHEGGGSWRVVDGAAAERLVAGDGADLGTALVGTGFGYDADVRAWQARVLLEVVPRVRDIRRIGSAALDICHVADGRLDGYYERGLNAWDMAAAWLVLAEAGGRFEGSDGPATPDLAIGAGAALMPALREVVTGAIERVGRLT